MSLTAQLTNAVPLVKSLVVSAWPALVGAALSMATATVRVWLQARAAKKLAAEAAFTDALNSDDLKKLSTYLRDEFGQVPLSMYLRNSDLRSRLDKYLVRLTDFVAPPPTEADAAKGQPVEGVGPATAVPLTTYWQNEPNDPPQIVAALQSARSGESWNALARLRRDLEARFRVALLGVNTDASRIPVHKLPIPSDAEYVFRRFYRSASRAIHGEDVSEDEVIQAIQDARVVYAIMEQSSPGWSTRPVSLVPNKRRPIF